MEGGKTMFKCFIFLLLFCFSRNTKFIWEIQNLNVLLN